VATLRLVELATVLSPSGLSVLLAYIGARYNSAPGIDKAIKIDMRQGGPIPGGGLEIDRSDMMTLGQRVKVWVKRRQRAQRFGVAFFRSKTLRMPNTLKINGHQYRIWVLDEESLDYEFANLFIDDAYGLSLLKGVETIIDVGANHGFFALCARGWFPDAVIQGYEPNPFVREQFEHNYRLVDAVPFPEAIGRLDGRVKIQPFKDSISARTKTTLDDDGIPMVSLKRALYRIGGTVDLLKLDCEGAEWELLNDADAFQHVKAVTMEYHDFGFDHVEHYREHAETSLLKLGFRIERHVPVNRYGHILAVRSP
jgi:FkbM family methyltransferase